MKIEVVDHAGDPGVAAYSSSLQALGMAHEILQHDEIRDFRHALEIMPLELADCVPTLLTMADGVPLVVVVRGDRKADFKFLKKTLAIKDLRMATPAEFTALTRLPVGTARVFNPGLRTVLDSSLLEREFAIGGSGSFCYSIRYRCADLHRIPGGEFLDVAGPGTRRRLSEH